MDQDHKDYRHFVPWLSKERQSRPARANSSASVIRIVLHNHKLPPTVEKSRAAFFQHTLGLVAETRCSIVFQDKPENSRTYQQPAIRLHMTRARGRCQSAIPCHLLVPKTSSVDFGDHSSEATMLLLE